MKKHVITEGERDIAVLRRLLGDAGRGADIEYHAAGGVSRAESLARSLLAVRNEPVALVVDADSMRGEAVSDRQESLESSLSSFAPHRKWTVVLMIPEIEALFFRDPEFLHGLAARVVPAALIERGEFDPRGAMERLLGDEFKDPDRFQNALDRADWSLLRAAPEAEKLFEFLRAS